VRLLRLSRRTPSRFSTYVRYLLTVGAEMSRCSAAATKLLLLNHMSEGLDAISVSMWSVRVGGDALLPQRGSVRRVVM